MNESLVKKIRQCPTLPSLPTVAIQVLDLAQKDQADIAEIAHVISKDPALSSKILRTVNSSFYGRSQSVSTITHALVILGLQSVKTLVLGFSLVTNLTKNKSKGFKHLNYWRRSIYAATAARTIAGRLNLVQQEECFLVALLMDIGMLVLDQILGEQYGEVADHAKTHALLAAAESEHLGLSHSEAAAILAEQWKLPPVLAIPIRHHDRPKDVQDPTLRRLTEVAYLAAQCADIFVDEQPADAINDVRKLCQDEYKISSADCDLMLDQIGRRTQEVAPLFEIPIASAATFENILKKANEALVEITLQSQQRATSLQQQNQQLKTQATTDALTGLANRGKYDLFIEEQFALATAQKRYLAVLILDVDHFKNINDRYGHQVGDQVLKVLGRLLLGTARTHDLAARYGGEELVLVLPGTTRATAGAIAETVRRTIAARPINCENVKVAVTVSVGVAVLEPGVPFRNPGQLVKAADMAVYAAKHGGRNCVRVFSPKPAAKAAGVAA